MTFTNNIPDTIFITITGILAIVLTIAVIFPVWIFCVIFNK